LDAQVHNDATGSGVGLAVLAVVGVLVVGALVHSGSPPLLLLALVLGAVGVAVVLLRAVRRPVQVRPAAGLPRLNPEETRARGMSPGAAAGTAVGTGIAGVVGGCALGAAVTAVVAVLLVMAVVAAIANAVETCLRPCKPPPQQGTPHRQ
jgi:hypothetical protein